MRMDLFSQPFYNDPVSTRIFAAIAVCLLTLAFPHVASASPGSVLVFSFENQTGDRNIDWIGTGLSEMVAERLSAEHGIYVFNRDERTIAYERMGIPESVAVSRATAMSIAWDTGADSIVIGRIYGSHEDFRIEARVLNMEDSSAWPDVVVTGELQNLIPMATSVSFKLARQLAPWSATPEVDYIGHPPVPSSAFEAYIRGTLAADSARRIALFQDAIRLHPQYAAAQFQLGRQYHLEMDFKNSTPMLEKIPEGSSEYLQAQFMLGLNYYNTGDFNKSAAIFSALPSVYDVFVNLGMADAGRNDTGGAMMAWKLATELNPLGSEAYFNMAFLGLTRGDRAETELAAKSIEQFLKLRGRDPEAIFLQGRIYERLGRPEEAQRLMVSAMNLSPRLQRWQNQVLPNLGRLRPQLSLTDIRIAPLTTLWTEARLARRASGRDVVAWLDMVQDFVDSQRYGEALQELQDIAQTFPRSAETHLMFAEVYENQKQYDSAVMEYQSAIALKPSADSWVLLARLYRTMNQTASERQAIESALSLEPRNSAAVSRKAELDRLVPRSGRRRL
jgi:tetratricopeptide (TPR) repeat protein/TolB-like protein